MTVEVLVTHVSPRLAKVPNVAKVAVLSPGVIEITTKDNRQFILRIGNLLDAVNSNTPAAESSVAEWLAGVEKTFVQKAGSKALTRDEFVARLMPVIKNNDYVTEFNKLAAQAAKSAPGMLARPIAGDIVFGVGLDEANRTRVLQGGSGKEFGVSDEELFAAAKRNLLNKVRSLQMREIGPIRIMDFDPDYNASLLVIDEVWSSVAPGREDDLIVAVPARDAVVFGLLSTDPKVVEFLREEANRPNQPYPVSTQLFRRSGKGWVVYK